VNADELPAVQKQRELLTKLKEVLQNELDHNQRQLDAAHEHLERIKNGGGS
jgi:hypothetical protein